jgi:hypothetical protein
MNFLKSMYCMSRYYFCYILFMMYCCFVVLAYMFQNRFIILIGGFLIIVLPFPESRKEIEKRYG